MGGHVDATLGVRTGRLWVVLTISPHRLFSREPASDPPCKAGPAGTVLIFIKV